MIDVEKGHVFFWRRPDFRPLRTLFSWIAAGIVMFLLITQIPLPFSQAMQKREKSKIHRANASQNLKPVVVVPADRLTASGITAHFSYNDPLNAAEAVNQLVDKAVSKKSDALLRSYGNTLTPHKIQFTEIPYSLTKIQVQPVILPELPQRKLGYSLSIPTQASEFTLQGSIKPNIEIPPLDVTSLGDSRQKLIYQLSVSSTGELLYAMPLDLTYRNERLEEWINTIDFPKTKSETSYSLSLELRRK